jgi:hypothetical protein
MTDGSEQRQTYRGLDGKEYTVAEIAHDRSPPPDLDLRVRGVVDRGHGVAGGGGAHAPHPEGSLARQYPVFLERGLDLGRCYPGTLNVSIRPLAFRVHDPRWVFKDVLWTPKQPAETFLFAGCAVENDSGYVEGFVYQPDPATKTVHFDDPSQVQVVAPFVPEVAYGSAVHLRLASSEGELVRPEE